MNVILLGPPGAGKGTQAKRLESVMKLPHIASGDIFREIRRQDGPLALQVREYMDRGDYVPDDLTIRLVLDRLNQPDAKDGFILDGFPRTTPQAEALDHELVKESRAVELALYITAPPEILADRIAGRIICPQCNAIYNSVSKPPTVEGICDVCGHRLERRTDESPAVIDVRLKAYLQQTKPLVEYYTRRGLLSRVDGARSIAEVEATVDNALGVRGAS
jgi:adenylate kinase